MLYPGENVQTNFGIKMFPLNQKVFLLNYYTYHLEMNIVVKVHFLVIEEPGIDKF